MKWFLALSGLLIVGAIICLWLSRDAASKAEGLEKEVARIEHQIKQGTWGRPVDMGLELVELGRAEAREDATRASILRWIGVAALLAGCALVIAPWIRKRPTPVPATT
jgi:hypothetical protein